MPSLTPEDREKMLGKKGFICPGCEEELYKNYCRQCDEFFYEEHKPGCKYEHNEHQGHRTY